MTTALGLHLAIIGGLGPIELIIILVIVLLLFGPMKLPQVGEALGKSIKSFKSAVKSTDDTVDVTPKALEEKVDSAESVEVAPAEEAEKA